MSIELINEIAKLKVAASSGGGGGTGSQFGGEAVTFVDKKQYFLSNQSTSNPLNAGSASYQRGFNHGDGQFSVAALPFIASGGTNTQFYVQPFTVNQTTGVITNGTGSTVWSNGSGNCQSTMNWGSGGTTAFNFGGHCGPGYSTNTGFATAWRVSGNAVTGGTNYTDGSSSWAANGNVDGAVTISGGTYYFAPGANDGTPKNLVFSYNGSSLSRTRNNALSGNNTTTNYVWPIVRQFGNLAATQGTLHIYRQTNSRMSFAVLGPTFDVQATVFLSDLGIPANQSMPAEAIGLELSNGRQLFYSKQLGIILRNGTTLTNVTSTADFIPNTLQRERSFTAVGPNTWICASEGSPTEVVKFSVNPTTYKVTILGSFSLSALVNNTSVANEQVSQGGLFITGSSNQFVVAISHHNNGPTATVWVGQHGLGGA